MHLPSLLKNARNSPIRRWWLNTLLNWKIPFNSPHGFEVRPLIDGGIRVDIPFWRVNLNHINGIHACALATAAEMCSGLALLEHLDPKNYRLIMRSIHMEYHFQAKKKAFATCIPSIEKIRDLVIVPLREKSTVEYESTVRVEDADGAHLATGTITWQVKDWSKVRTKI